MAVSGINVYNNALYQWKGQKLSSSGNSSSSTSSAASSLFNNASMENQVSSMVELTKYAMNAMGLSNDSRVTFSQITKYANQLQSEFNQGVKKGFEESGIKDLSKLVYTVDNNGKITVSGGSEEDRKKAQGWIDANPSYGESIRAAIGKVNLNDKDMQIQFRLSSSGKMTLIDKETENIQAWLNDKKELSEDLRTSLTGLQDIASWPLEFSYDGNTLKVKGEESEKINKFLEENPAFSEALRSELQKNNIELSSVSLRLNKEGAAQITVHNADINDIQAALDTQIQTGAKIYTGLSSQAIDPNIAFTIQFDESGKLNIISDHPDRDKVQKFFEDNPELIKKYQQIETLAGIEDARKAMQISPTSMRKRIQIESLAAWWADSGDANSYFGQYSDNSLSLLAGLNIQV